MNSSRTLIIAALLITISCSIPGLSQTPTLGKWHTDLFTYDSIDFATLRSPVKHGLMIDSEDFESIISNPTRHYTSAVGQFLAPAVYDSYRLLDTIPLMREQRDMFGNAYQWLDDYEASYNILQRARQNFIFDHPNEVQYNLADLPEPPKAYRAYVDPITTNIVLEEIKVEPTETPLEITPDITYKRWLHDFNASLQFSQAYISPNWYQGGNNNLNMIGQAIYHIKLNPKFYPNILFETTLQYKLALNKTSDDSIHAANISEDILQLNTTFGLKAAKRWYYSANLMFKTQLFNSYPTNSRSLKSAFMSPGELNVGLGMTYNYESPKKNFTFGASVSPLSWNLKTCIHKEMDPTAYGIKENHKLINTFGSSAELTAMWKVAYNIVYSTRLFMFTDYKLFQGDWEHTIDFNINKFLSTRLYVHMRYDTQTQRPDENAKWHKFQLKEIFSFGFSYHFGV